MRVVGPFYYDEEEKEYLVFTSRYMAIINQSEFRKCIFCSTFLAIRCCYFGESVAWRA